MCLFHKWGKWSKYESTSIKNLYGMRYICSSVHQTRTCERCGYSQDEYLYSKDIAKIKEVELVDKYSNAGQMFKQDPGNASMGFNHV